MKKGFTLAEILATLSIIGVVAALTMPALLNETGQAKIGPSLSKFVNTFESGVKTMMVEDALSGLKGDVGGHMSTLSKYVLMAPADKTYTFKDAKQSQDYSITAAVEKQKEVQDAKKQKEGATQKDIDNADKEKAKLDSLANDTTAWLMKDGCLMMVIPVTDYTEINQGAYRGIVAEVIVDINGDKAPNLAGKDVFAFLLDDTGSLVPAGSKLHKYIKQKGTLFVTSDYENDDDQCKLDDNIVHNFACTGKVADNHWKAKY